MKWILSKITTLLLEVYTLKVVIPFLRYSSASMMRWGFKLMVSTDDVKKGHWKLETFLTLVSIIQQHTKFY